MSVPAFALRSTLAMGKECTDHPESLLLEFSVPWTALPGQVLMSEGRETGAASATGASAAA